MKKTFVFIAMIAAATPAVADVVDNSGKQKYLLNELGMDIGGGFSQDRKTKAWHVNDGAVANGKATCATNIAKLAELDTPGTAKLDLSNDIMDLKKGEHTLDEMLPLCEQIVAFSKASKWLWVTKNAVYEFPKVGPKTPYNEKHFENCISEYGAMMKAGVPPTYKIPDEIVLDIDQKDVVFGGTVEEIRKKWCDVGLKNAKAETERRDAPYKKVLKADKLSYALTYRSVWLAGGGATSDPKQMASSNVWFTDSFPGLVCLKRGTPEVHELTRLEFDASHKLVRSSSTKYCGDPPSSAFK